MKPATWHSRLALLVCLLALTSAQRALAQTVLVRRVFTDLTLGPGSSGTWFVDNVSQASVRWFTAVPVGKGSTCIDCPSADYDQFLEITNVFQILKGQGHARDGTGGQGTLQANVTVLNRDRAHPVEFDIYMAEVRSQ
jgi:hypothetical protein